MKVKQPPIITTTEWGAVPPKVHPIIVGKPERIIYHHTAGHHPELQNPLDESREEAIRYARDIQHFHMVDRGWNDSGHNWLVCRNGLILVGRHQSFTQMLIGRMVMSAHCPGQNDQPGIEHEHNGLELMTPIQFERSAWLHAWIISQCGMRSTGTVFPHGHFFPTSCPGRLNYELPRLRKRIVQIINHGGP